MQSKATTTGKRIFISYRRDDALSASGRIWDWLRIAFGREQVFRDVISIGPGKWRDKIDAALADSAVCLAVIGTHWCDATNGPRLTKKSDIVRHELVTALARSAEGLTLILTLVEGAKVPPKGKLPAQLHDLLEWNAYPLSEEGWEDDMRRLLGAVAECTGQPQAADVDSLLSRFSEAEAHIHELEQEKHLQVDQVRALIDTVAALTRQLVERPATHRADLEAALEALGRGDTSAAEAEFERVLEDRSAVAAGAAHEAAVAARHIANLALFGDVDKALRYYRRACDLDPGHGETWRLLGQAWLTAGDTSEARNALTRALQEADKSGDVWDRMAALVVLGDLALATEHLGEALSRYEAALKMVNEEATRDPANTGWQRDLSVSNEKIGNVLIAQGDLAAALAAYRASLAIHETLTARDPANTGWQRDLTVSHDRIGDVLKAQGDLAGALAAYRASLAIAETLTAHDPANTGWQRDLSVSHIKIGDVLVAQGELAEALAAYRASLAIAETLAPHDLANTEWQRDLSVSHERIGFVLVAQGELAGALAAYRDALAIAEMLAARDPANIQWQIDVAISCSKLGLYTGFSTDERRDYLRRGLEILQGLKASGRLPPDQDWIGWFEAQLRKLDKD